MRAFNILFFSLSFGLFFGVFSPNTSAKTLDFKPMSIDVKPQDKYLIRGFKGKITLVGKPNSQILKVSLRQTQPNSVSSDMKEAMDEWLFQVQRRDNTVEVVVKTPHSKASIAKSIQSQQMPTFDMQLEGPPRMLEMGLRDGTVRIENWSSQIKLYAQRADVSLKKGEGDVQIAVQEGQINVSNQKGRLGIETYSAKVNVKDSEGPLTVVNFSGSTDIGSHNGSVDLNGYQGTFLVNKGTGRLEFDVDRASVKISERQGELRGKSLQGPITASTLGEAEIRLTTTEGNVNLNLINSGAHLNVGTDEGQIYAPNYLSVSKGEKKLLQGRLNGKNSGQVYVRSQTGSIRLK